MAKIIERSGSHVRVKVGDVEIEARALNNDLLANVLDFAKPSLMSSERNGLRLICKRL